MSAVDSYVYAHASNGLQVYYDGLLVTNLWTRTTHELESESCTPLTHPPTHLPTRGPKILQCHYEVLHTSDKVTFSPAREIQNDKKYMIPARGPQTVFLFRLRFPVDEDGNELTCQQALRARHLLTMRVFY